MEMPLHCGASFGGAIGGFALSDTIDITNLTPQQVAKDFASSYFKLGGGAYDFTGVASGEILTTPTDGTLRLTGNFSSDRFLLTPDAGGGTAPAEAPEHPAG